MNNFEEIIHGHPSNKSGSRITTLGFKITGLCTVTCIFHITLLRSKTMLCGKDNNPHNILYIQSECEDYPVEYRQSHTTLLWISIMLSITRTERKMKTTGPSAFAFKTGAAFDAWGHLPKPSLPTP